MQDSDAGGWREQQSGSASHAFRVSIAFVILSALVFLVMAPFLLLQHDVLRKSDIGVPGDMVRNILKIHKPELSLRNDALHRVSVEEVNDLTCRLRPIVQPLPGQPESATYNNLHDLIAQWNPDDVEVPLSFAETLQSFDFSNITERSYAGRYKRALMPFKMFNIPEINRVVDLWTDEYLLSSFTNMTTNTLHVETAPSNHFMFWKARRHDDSQMGYIPPTTKIENMTFSDWLSIAKGADVEQNVSRGYFYALAAAGPPRWTGTVNETFIHKDWPLFHPEHASNFFVDLPRNKKPGKTTQCRFGMRGIMAEAHYDAMGNMVALTKGKKRYLLAPPWACDHLDLIKERSHPSYRHSQIDWTDMEQVEKNRFREVPAWDTVLLPGQVLHIPDHWFHYPISLNYNIQCNIFTNILIGADSRGGNPNGKYVKKCGFPV